jgi:RNA polymerase sigma-70 factor, ECF subfamily
MVDLGNMPPERHRRPIHGPTGERRLDSLSLGHRRASVSFSPQGTFSARYGLNVREGDAADAPEFLDRLRAGDARAFEELVASHQHRVFGVALRMLGGAAEAEEVAQEAFLRAHRSLGEFRGDAKLSTWLYTIVSRLCLNRLASGDRRAVRHGEDALLRVADEGGGPEVHAERGELEGALHRAIAELPEERRVVIILRDLEGLSYEEIAVALGLELGTVRSRLHRARMDLKDKLERFLP